LVHVGQLSQQLNLPDLRVRHQFSAATRGTADVITDLEYWPFAERSLDAILLTAKLEFERDPHQVLREMSRSLVNDGHLIIAGFNPFSFAMLTGFWPGQGQRYPWQGRYFSKMRVHDWLALLNFEIISSDYIAPSLLIEKLQPADRGLRKLYSWLPQVGSMYYIIARKREFPLTTIRWSKRVKTSMQTMPLAQRVK
jgi:SAM-dependent methyltransferase